LPAAAGRRDEAIRIGGGHVDDLERAFTPIKVPPVLGPAEPRRARATSPTRASRRRGHHVVSILASYAPYTLKRLDRKRRERPRRAVVAELEKHARLRAQIVAGEVLTPKDLEQEFALTGGQSTTVSSPRPASGLARPRAPRATATSVPASSSAAPATTPAAGPPDGRLLAAAAVLNRKQQQPAPSLPCSLRGERAKKGYEPDRSRAPQLWLCLVLFGLATAVLPAAALAADDDLQLHRRPLLRHPAALRRRTALTGSFSGAPAAAGPALGDLTPALVADEFHDGVEGRGLADSFICKFEIATDGGRRG